MAKQRGMWTFSQWRQAWGAWGTASGQLQRLAGVRSRKAFCAWPWSRAAVCLLNVEPKFLQSLSNSFLALVGQSGGAASSLTHLEQHLWEESALFLIEM